MTEKPRLLIVDDDSKNLHSTKRILEDLPLSIKTVLSGEEALRALVKDSYFLILMDVQMPGMDGFETTSLIRGSVNFQDIPIIFITAISKEDKHVLRGYEGGAVDYLFKPVNPVILKSKISVFLDLESKKRKLEMTIEKLEKAGEELGIKKELEFSNKELNKKNQELLVYDHMVAHDLNAPLRNIISYVSLIMESESSLDMEIESYLKHIDKNSQRARNLINGILEFSAADKSNELKEICDIRMCVDAAIDNLDSVIQEKNVQLIIGDLPGEINCVSIKVQQLFQNLISNSIKYQSDGQRPEVKIYMESQKAENEIKINVEDNGIGIPAEKLKEIFEPFKRLQSVAKFEGSGIGLATCKKIVEFHNWEIKADRLKEGTKFVIELWESESVNE